MERIDRMAEVFETKEESKITLDELYKKIGEVYAMLDSIMQSADKTEVDEEEKTEYDEDEKDSNEEDKEEE